MKPEWRRFAPFGLYLSGLAAIAAVVLYVVQREFSLAVQICLALVVVGLALFALLDPDRVRRMFTGRQARYGSNALVLTLAFIGILGVINYLAYKNDQRWDMTEDKQFTLAPETVDVLSKLEEPVKALAFYSARVSTDTARSLLEQFEQESGGKFSFEFIDPEANPVQAEQAKITQDGTIVLTSGDRQQAVRSASEQELAGGLVRLLNPQAQTIYFLTGHGEYSPEETGDQAYSAVKRTLEGKNYTVKMLNLPSENQVPEDAKLIMVVGPRTPLSEQEVTLLKQYLEQGGSMIVMEEPLPTSDFGDAQDPLADYLLTSWGIDMGKDILVDQTSQQPFWPFGVSYGNHPITTPIQRTNTVFLTSRSVRASTEAGAGVSLSELVFTGPNSWAETDLAGVSANPPQVINDEADMPGPVPLSVAAENLENKGRLVAFGDADFATDGNYMALANLDLLMNSVDWAIGQEDLISLTPKNTTQRVVLPPQGAVLNLIYLGTVIVLPALALLGGIVIFIQRRRRG